MKPNKLIKAFMPFATSAAFYDWCGRAAKMKDPAKTVEAIKYFIGREPNDTEWSNVGLVAPVEEGSYVHDLDGAARLLMFQFNERKLPASVRDKEVKRRYDELVAKGDRKLNKKEFAQLREDVENALLPQAFVVPSVVPVLVFKDRILICSTSAKRVESVLIMIARLCEMRKVAWEFIDIKTTTTPGFLLGQVARNGVQYIGADDEAHLAAGKKGKFKGEDKRTISVSERDVSSDEVQKIMATGTYNVVELSMALHDDEAGTLIAEFALTDKFVFKAVKLSDITLAGVGNDPEDLHATYWLLAKTFQQILGAVVVALNDGEGGDDDSDDL